MQIKGSKMKIQTINRNTNIQSKYEKKLNYNVTNSAGQEVNFKSTSGLILLVAKHGISALSLNNKLKYVRNLDDLYCRQSYFCIPDYLDRADNLRLGYAALAKTPDSFWDGEHNTISEMIADVVFNLSGYVTNSVGHIRERALSKMPNLDLLGIFNDFNKDDVQIKKDFLRSYLDNKHEINECFQNIFSDLDDSIYKSFKEEIINTCLYSRSYNANRNYSKKRHNDAALINTLDKNTYSDFLKQL